MRYHFNKPDIYLSMYGEIYVCDHPIYNRCTLFKIGNKGLAIIQQRFNQENKSTYWTEIDEWVNDALYTNIKFKSYFDKFAKECENGLYPTVCVRQIMWALKMKPIKRQPWETSFDHVPI